MKTRSTQKGAPGKSVTKPNKQHDVRAASFLRIAKEIEGVAQEHSGSEKCLLCVIAAALKGEAKVLRGMR